MKNLSFIKTPLVFGSVLLMLSFSMAFSLKKDGPKGNKKEKIAESKKPFCNCGTPVITGISYSSGNVTFTWNAVPGAVFYRLSGRYFNYTTPPVFDYCLTTLGASIPAHNGGDYAVLAICDGTCANPTCASSGGASGSF